MALTSFHRNDTVIIPLERPIGGSVNISVVHVLILSIAVAPPPRTNSSIRSCDNVGRFGTWIPRTPASSLATRYCASSEKKEGYTCFLSSVEGSPRYSYAMKRFSNDDSIYIHMTMNTGHVHTGRLGRLGLPYYWNFYLQYYWRCHLHHC